MWNRIRRFMCLTLAMLFVSCMALPFSGTLSRSAYAETQTVGETYVVKAHLLNVRSGPGKKHAVVTKLKKGTEVTFNNKDNGWWNISYSGGNGYVYGKYLKKKTNTGFAEEGTLYVTTSNLNMRSRGTIKSRKLGTLKKDTQVTLVLRRNYWSKIRYGNVTAWVSNRYIKKVE